MNYKILISSRTQIEIENAINFYSINSDSAPRNFVESLNECYSSVIKISGV